MTAAGKAVLHASETVKRLLEAPFQSVPPLKNSDTDQRAHRALEAEELAGLRLAARGRAYFLTATAVLLCFIGSFPSNFYYFAWITFFIGLEYLRLWGYGQSWRRDWHAYAIIASEFICVVYILLGPNPFFQIDYIRPISLRFEIVAYVYVLLISLTFCFRPALVLWGGFVAALSWAGGVYWLSLQPYTTVIPLNDPDAQREFAQFGDPNTIDLGVAAQNCFLLLLLGALLAGVVKRSRDLVLRHAQSERQRSNLARYFSPATVDRLANRTSTLGEIREQNVAVLFVDLRGFTTWSERHTPVQVIELLRNVHARLEQTVFAHGGALDKFIGDGMMATFGTPEPSPRDVSNAIACLTQILDDFADGVAPSADDSGSTLTISAGLHCGPVVVGDIGTERRLELAVLGDTVNVASRLEALTRTLGTRAAMSAACLRAAQREDPAGADRVLVRAAPLGPQTLKGRDEPVEVWGFR